MAEQEKDIAKERINHPTIGERIRQNIQDYAEADKSDPFTAARCAAHYRQGICNPMIDANGHVHDRDYEATSVREETYFPGPNGTVLFGHVTRYKNIRRP